MVFTSSQFKPQLLAYFVENDRYAVAGGGSGLNGDGGVLKMDGQKLRKGLNMKCE